MTDSLQATPAISTSLMDVTRADVVGIFPDEASIMRLIGAVLFEQSDAHGTASLWQGIRATTT